MFSGLRFQWVKPKLVSNSTTNACMRNSHDHCPCSCSGVGSVVQGGSVELLTSVKWHLIMFRAFFCQFVH